MIVLDKARTHIENAKELFRINARPEDGLYQERKYVKKAGLIAYQGLMLSLVQLLKENRKGNTFIIEQELPQLDSRIFADYITAQQILNKAMGLNGTRSQELAELGILEAEKIITWVEQSLTHKYRRAETL